MRDDRRRQRRTVVPRGIHVCSTCVGASGCSTLCLWRATRHASQAPSGFPSLVWPFCPLSWAMSNRERSLTSGTWTPWDQQSVGIIFAGTRRASAKPALCRCSHCARACQSRVEWPLCQTLRLPALAARTISRRERSNSLGRRCSAPDPANVCAATWARLSETTRAGWARGAWEAGAGVRRGAREA